MTRSKAAPQAGSISWKSSAGISAGNDRSVRLEQRLLFEQLSKNRQCAQDTNITILTWQKCQQAGSYPEQSASSYIAEGQHYDGSWVQHQLWDKRTNQEQPTALSEPSEDLPCRETTGLTCLARRSAITASTSAASRLKWYYTASMMNLKLCRYLH